MTITRAVTGSVICLSLGVAIVWPAIREWWMGR